MKIESTKGVLSLDEATLCFNVEAEGESWSWEKDYRPCFLAGEEKVFFSDAASIRHEAVKNGIGKGIRSSYSGFIIAGEKKELAFETYAWIEECTGDVFFEWVPIKESGEITKLFWPGPMAFEEKREDWYTLVNERQGYLIPNTWEVPSRPLHFKGQFCTAGGYMSWFSQIREGKGYIAIALTPWNGFTELEHPAGGPYTHVSVSWEPSLGKMDYRRIMRYSFRKDCDYNTMCKIYRNYMFENDLAATLKEKAARIPSVDRLVGASFVHKGIKTSVNPKSEFFDPAAPEKNNSLTPFAVREKEMEEFHEFGVEKLYFHLDGWAEPGYDNKHPDYLPACEEAGGWEKMKSLSDTMQRLGYLFGIHDQYRDYYKDAPSFDEDYAVRLTDGSIPEHARWAGGPQSYLCATQAPYYVRRNFTEIKNHGIHLDGAYLDVFTCNEGDECDNPRHRMSRKECYENRKKCFDFLISRNILPSSEEASDWAMKSLVFCHYAPYSFMLQTPGTEQIGVSLPLFNLVYHDCVIEPWMMEKLNDTDDYMLYALLNGGAPYLVRDGAYPNIDGAFDGYIHLTPEEIVKRCKIVSGLHEKVAKEEMVSHEFVNGDYKVQRTTFADGTRVTVDLCKGTYEIETK